MAAQHPQRKWDMPNDWMREKIETWDEEKVRDEFNAMVDQLSDEAIEEEYRTEMTRDGFYDEEVATENPAKHTSSPWLVVCGKNGELEPFGGKNMTHLLSPNVDNPLPLKERLANARLIENTLTLLAIANCLLAICKECVHVLSAEQVVLINQYYSLIVDIERGNDDESTQP